MKFLKHIMMPVAGCFLFLAAAPFSLRAQDGDYSIPDEEYQAMLGESFLGEAEKVEPAWGAEEHSVASSSFSGLKDFLSDENGKSVSGLTEITVSDLPGYPKYIDSGNPERDSEAFEKAVARWMAENPENQESKIRKGQP